jgi:hypothetical protein
MRWFKSLKKWQKGALIGCGVGLIFASIMMLSLRLEICLESREAGKVGWWIVYLHAPLHIIFALFMRLPYIMADLATSGAIIVCYGGFGAVVGRVQQMAKPVWKWLLTALLALFLLFIYWFNYQLATALEHA